MIESPLLEELKAEWTRETTLKYILKLLQAHFGVEGRDLEFALNSVKDEHLDEIFDLAATATTLASFREQLTAKMAGQEP